MKIRRRFTHRFRWLRLLRWTLTAGAVYDLAFAALMVAAPGVPSRLLGLPLPGARFYLWILAVFLVMLAALYGIAALDPRRYSAIIAVAIGGRMLGAVAFVVAAILDPGLEGLYLLAAADALFALSHAVCWWPQR
jgi:hypothetical protein